LPDTVAVPTVVPPVQAEGAEDRGPITPNVTVPEGEDPPDSTAETDEALMFVPTFPDRGALTDSLGLAGGVPV
jgi:hypothetical protein